MIKYTTVAINMDCKIYERGINMECTIIRANSFDTLVVKENDTGQKYQISIYSGYSWNIIQEFQEFNCKNLVGRKVILNFRTRQLFAAKGGRGGIQWENVRILK